MSTTTSAYASPATQTTGGFGTYPGSMANGTAKPTDASTAVPSPSLTASTVGGLSASTTQNTNQSIAQQQTSTTTNVSSTIQAAITTEVRTAMTHVLSNVPWIKFRVHAEPDLQVFQTDVQLQQALTQISQVAASSIAQTIITEFSSQMQTLIQSITKTASTQISTTMIQLIQELITVSTLTHFSTNASPLIIPGIPDCPSDSSIVIVEPLPPKIPIDNGSIKPIGPKIPISEPIVNPATDTLNPTPDLGTASWIWTREVLAGFPPGGARPFRKIFESPVPVDRLTLDITCDNFYTVYVNGLLVGSGRDWTTAQRYKVSFQPPTQDVVVAVYGVQDAVTLREAGLLVAAVTWNTQLPRVSPSTFGTDSTWKTLTTESFSPEFLYPDFADGDWQNAVVEGPYGMAPWGNVAKPATYSSQVDALTNLPGGTPDAPRASRATVLLG